MSYLKSPWVSFLCSLIVTIVIGLNHPVTPIAAASIPAPSFNQSHESQSVLTRTHQEPNFYE
jgi:hypothetical protein